MTHHDVGSETTPRRPSSRVGTVHGDDDDDDDEVAVVSNSISAIFLVS